MTPIEYEITPERQIAVDKAIIEDELSDLKKHATNMLLDFGRFNDFSSNRAIWELVQNACDLTKHCEITLDYRNEKFAFTHNGRPFTSNSLISLIKQVSGDKDGLSEIPPVGKYGTGFLTTHSLGRKFVLDGFLETSGQYIEIKDFLIDRSDKKWPELSRQIKLQKDKVFEIIGKGTEVFPATFSTTFTYLPETDQERNYVKESYRDLEEYLPLILTINNRLKSAKIISKDGNETLFTRLEKESIINEEEILLYKTTVLINNDEKVVYSIAENYREIEIILPINKDHQLFTFSDRVARLFLYYPLVGSEHFGMNFIINCNKFMPTEPRDAIHLFSEKDQFRDDESVNQVLIEKASDLLFKFLDSTLIPVENPLLYADINFKRGSDDLLQNKYFTSLQTKWIDEFKYLTIVKTKDGYKNALEVFFPIPELLENDKYFDSVYYLAEKFFPVMPTKETVREWSNFIANWGFEKANYITNEVIVAHIELNGLSDFEFDHLKNYYDYLLEAGLEKMFMEYELLPNLDGVFQPFNLLKIAQNIDKPLVEIGKKMIPKSIAQLIDPRFKFSFPFDNYNRRSFSNSITNKLNEEELEDLICLPKDYKIEEFDFDEEPGDELYDLETFLALLDYCKLNSSKDSNSKPMKLMSLISKYYGVDAALIEIKTINSQDEDLEQRAGQKKIVQIFLNTLYQHTSEWVEGHIDFIYEIISYNEDRFKDVFLSSEIYPNQVFGLELITSLKKDGGITDDIYKLYNTVTKKEIGEFLGHKKFNEFLIEKNEEMTNKTLSTVIEDIIFGTDITDINEHPFKSEIL
ncbi:ATP-binding protein [Mucilaginibacter sp. KACC 22773]|uniref:sacsin N-terminal ATP-binding-like domain-containing protein n=1 Tax=Mucilaginibacter sp. KACC 22773 TaxID=3025671 RepID=UPI0023673503|nr:ATP-binding protein [Mucilaginibacter sp. KACC 22773]WDF77023.1 ATP-binding protein [Mucilaginibacter sp. KACC 22773]